MIKRYGVRESVIAGWLADPEKFWWARDPGFTAGEVDGIHHAAGCVHRDEPQTEAWTRMVLTDCQAGCERTYPLHFGHGRVLSIRSRSHWHDTDVYAAVWVGPGEGVREYLVASTRLGTRGEADVDATTKAKEGAAGWVRTWALRELRHEAERDARTVKVGRMVTVFGLRCAVLAQRVSATGRITYKFATDTPGHHEWHDATDCEIDPFEYMTNEQTLEDLADHITANIVAEEAWSLPFTGTLPAPHTPA